VPETGNEDLSSENEAAVAAEPYLSPIIPDGYNKTSTIPARPGKWSAVTLRWRKFSADQVSAIAARSVRGGDGFCRYEAEEMAPRKDAATGLLRPGNVIDWDVKDAAGNKAPVTVEAIKNADPEWYAALLSVISGEKPEWEIPVRDATGLATSELKNLLRA
jgi:hypothetical protein